MSRFLICGLLLAISCLVYGEDKHDHPLPAAPKHAQFEKLKGLAGTWLMTDKDGKPTEEVASVIKVTAGGSAVQETLFPGQPHEMILMYTVEGSDLVLTHYCVLGNQPRMKADPKSPNNQIKFEFAGGPNLDPKKDHHMHGATLTFIDDKHVQVEGEGWENGKPSPESCGIMKLVRKQ